MSWITVRTSYGCPYRKKHKVDLRGRETYYCTLTGEECRYRPKRCPVRAQYENKSMTEFLGG